jgi:hypothetical protein
MKNNATETQKTNLPEEKEAQSSEPIEGELNIEQIENLSGGFFSTHNY